MIEKKWIFQEGEEPELTEAIANQLNLHPVLAKILVNRGVTDVDSAKAFFKPKITELHSPFLMKGMDLASKRLSSAIDKKEPILVYGDYDVDGTTSVAMMYLFLKKLGCNVRYYVPDRYTEGYGVSKQGIEFASDNSCSLIITLDCGIRANKMIDYAAGFGIDVIVCDHHNPGEKVPSALAVLDPKQTDCNYPFKELSGCGVGFKLIHAVCERSGLDLKENLFCFLDLLCVSIASDIVPIIGENRVLAYFGLKKLVMSPMTGLKALLQLAELDSLERLSIADLVFKIGPRINAAGRIETGSRAVELLIADSVDFAKNIALEVDCYNEDRKGIDRQITQEALAMIAENEIYGQRKTTVVFNESWHKGVVGIVASRLIEQHYKPTIVLTYSDGKITGSARSVEGFDLYQALEKCQDLLTNWGGHKYAAGLSMHPDNLEMFKTRFDEAVSSTITEELLTPKIYVDSLLELDAVNGAFYSQLCLFEPFGPGNMTPVFASKDLADAGGSRAVGADKSHLKLSVLNSDTGAAVNGIGFGLGHIAEEVQNGAFDAAYSIAENRYNGKVSLQLMVRDLKLT